MLLLRNACFISSSICVSLQYDPEYFQRKLTFLVQLTVLNSVRGKLVGADREQTALGFCMVPTDALLLQYAAYNILCSVSFSVNFSVATYYQTNVFVTKTHLVNCIKGAY